MISWSDKDAATYGALSACILARVWGLDVGVRVGRQRSLQLTKVAIWWVVIHRRMSDLRIHVSGLLSTLEGQGPLAFISQVMLVKTHIQSIIPGHPRKWNETEKNTAITTLSDYTFTRVITRGFRFPVCRHWLHWFLRTLRKRNSVNGNPRIEFSGGNSTRSFVRSFVKMDECSRRSRGGT